MTTAAPRSRKGAKIIAIASAAALAAVGGTLSIAAWTDTEWLTSMADSDGDGLPDSPINTSTFEVAQYAYAPDLSNIPADATAFTHHETQAEANTITFDVANISPGDSTYALVALTTPADSIGGDLELLPAVDAGDAGLFDNTTVSIYTWNEVADEGAEFTPDYTCGAGIELEGLTTTTGALGSTGAASTPLRGEGGDVQYYCFELVFDVPAGGVEEDFMGLELVPEWEYSAVSTS